MRTTVDGYYTDEETGETIPIPKGSKVVTPQDQDRIQRALERKKEKSQEVAKVALTTKAVCGDFYWLTFEPDKPFYPDVSEELLAKIIYLLTYVSYDTQTLTIQEGVRHTKRNMTKSDVRELIKLSDKRFAEFWKSMLGTGIIVEEDDGSLKVCDSFFKGKLHLNKKENVAAMKIFSHSVRYLYENTDIRSHRYLAYLFRVVPYINLRYNVLCNNPLETDQRKVAPITARELCKLIGLDESNQTRLTNNLLKLSFVDKQGDKRSVVRIITDYKNDERRNFITINPQFYSGYMANQELLGVVDEFLLDVEL